MPESAKATRCPHCRGPVIYPLGLGFLVCRDCCSMLYVNELVPHA